MKSTFIALVITGLSALVSGRRIGEVEQEHGNKPKRELTTVLELDPAFGYFGAFGGWRPRCLSPVRPCRLRKLLRFWWPGPLFSRDRRLYRRRLHRKHQDDRRGPLRVSLYQGHCRHDSTRPLSSPRR
jgi:hypothetical protein